MGEEIKTVPENLSVRNRIRDLNPAPYNPRKITDRKLTMLRKSLADFGDLSGIIRNIQTGNLIGGHQRIRVLPPDCEVIASPCADSSGSVAAGWIETAAGRFIVS
jgi:hypothetical protein